MQLSRNPRSQRPCVALWLLAWQHQVLAEVYFVRAAGSSAAAAAAGASGACASGAAHAPQQQQQRQQREELELEVYAEPGERLARLLAAAQQQMCAAADEAASPQPHSAQPAEAAAAAAAGAAAGAAEAAAAEAAAAEAQLAALSPAPGAAGGALPLTLRHMRAIAAANARRSSVVRSVSVLAAPPQQAGGAAKRARASTAAPEAAAAAEVEEPASPEVTRLRELLGSLSAAGLEVSDLSGAALPAASPSSCTGGAVQDTAHAPTGAPSSGTPVAGLCSALGALPAQRPGVAVLVLPPLVPPGRPAAQQGPSARRGSRTAAAPHLLAVAVPVLSRVRSAWPALPALQHVVLLCREAGHVGTMRTVAGSCFDRP
jgi:hypothetical protein